MAVTHRFTIICDDTRREDNGKLILLGMYVGTITVPHLIPLFPVVKFRNSNVSGVLP